MKNSSHGFLASDKLFIVDSWIFAIQSMLSALVYLVTHEDDLR